MNDPVLFDKLKFGRENKLAAMQEGSKVDSIISTDMYGEKSKYVYYYDKMGNVTSFIIFYWLNSSWINLTKVVNRFNSKGDIASTEHLYSNGDTNWFINFKESFYYDSAGYQKLHIVQSLVDDHWENEFRVIDSLDTKANVYISIQENWIEGNWVNLYRITEDYFENGSQDVALLEKWENNSWQNNLMYFVKYDDYNDVSSILINKWMDSNWQYFAKTRYVYNEEKTEISHYFEIWENDDWLLIERYIHYLNSNKYLLHSKYEYRTVGNTWVPGDGILHVINPDGFEAHFLSSKVNVYYNEPTTVEVDVKSVPEKFTLAQNYPNPFNPSTTIEYSIPTGNSGFYSAEQQVSLIIYDLLGRKVATLVNSNQSPGHYKVVFNASSAGSSAGSGLTSGIYLYKLTAGSYTETKKMILVR